MKTILLVYMSLALPLNSCSFKTETPLEAYIKKQNPNLESLEIIEVSERDSIYSPYKELMSLSYIYSKLGVDIVELSAKAFEAKSGKEAIFLLDSALTMYTKENAKLNEVANKCFKAIDYPSLIDEKNRVFIKAKYAINGNIEERNFYFNEDGETIGHTDEDIRKIANDVFYSQQSLLKDKKEIESDKRAIKRGEYQFETK